MWQFKFLPLIRSSILKLNYHSFQKDKCSIFFLKQQKKEKHTLKFNAQRFERKTLKATELTKKLRTWKSNARTHKRKFLLITRHPINKHISCHRSDMKIFFSNAKTL